MLSVVLGRRSRPVFEHVVASRSIVISARAVEELHGVLRSATGLPSDVSARANTLLAGLTVAHHAVYAELLDAAGDVLEQAVASRDASRRDAHLLACAWVFDADLWTHESRLCGRGLAVVVKR